MNATVESRRAFRRLPGQTGEFAAEWGLWRRSYNPEVGRFVSVDPHPGDLLNPVSLHKYLYANADPINHVDPTGLFSVASSLSVTGIQGIISSGVSVLNAGSRVYRGALAIKQVYDYARMALRFASAMNAPTPAAAAAVLASEFRDVLGNNVNSLLDGFNQMGRELGRNWRSVAKQIVHRAPQIAADAFLAVSANLQNYIRHEAAGNLQIIFFMPTGPQGREGDRIFNVTRQFGVAVSPTGGRLFGFGVRTGGQIGRSGARANGYDQWFRVDWYDRTQNPHLNVHYHVHGEPDRHPGPHRVIWKP
jgi:RHS repeat-associated protein